MTVPRWLLILRDLASTGTGTFGIIWLLVTGSQNFEMYLVFLSLLGVPVAQHSLALISGTGSQHSESPEQPSLPVPPPQSTKL